MQVQTDILLMPQANRVYTHLILLTGLFLGACSQQADETLQQLNGRTMGTTFSVSIVGEHTILPAEISALLTGIDESMSTYHDDSELMQLNRAPLNTWFRVSAPLFEVLSLSQEISALSEGAFDITVAPLVNLWGFGPRLRTEDTLPTSSEIDALMAEVSFEHLWLDAERQSVMKTHALSLDLSAVAKGYAVDALAALLENRNIENYLVEIGGEIRSKGHNPENQAWRIAIEKPEAGNERAAQRLIEVDTAALATSGDYRNYFMLDGRRYSHTIDPETGYPIAHSLVSVTVLADTAARADALATAFLVMGETEAKALAEKSGIAAYFLLLSDNEFSESYSSAFSSYLFEQGNP